MMAIVGLLRWSSLVELVADFLITYFAALTEQQRQHLSIMMLVQTENDIWFADQYASCRVNMSERYFPAFLIQ